MFANAMIVNFLQVTFIIARSYIWQSDIVFSSSLSSHFFSNISKNFMTSFNDLHFWGIDSFGLSQSFLFVRISHMDSDSLTCKCGDGPVQELINGQSTVNGSLRQTSRCLPCTLKVMRNEGPWATQISLLSITNEHVQSKLETILCGFGGESNILVFPLALLCTVF